MTASATSKRIMARFLRSAHRSNLISSRHPILRDISYSLPLENSHRKVYQKVALFQFGCATLQIPCCAGYLYTVEELDFYAQCHCLFRAEPNRITGFLFAAADFAEITTIHPLGKMAIRGVTAVPADFPVIAAAHPLGGAAVREAAAIC